MLSAWIFYAITVLSAPPVVPAADPFASARTQAGPHEVASLKLDWLDTSGTTACPSGSTTIRMRSGLARS